MSDPELSTSERAAQPEAIDADTTPSRMGASERLSRKMLERQQARALRHRARLARKARRTGPDDLPVIPESHAEGRSAAGWNAELAATQQAGLDLRRQVDTARETAHRAQAEAAAAKDDARRADASKDAALEMLEALEAETVEASRDAQLALTRAEEALKVANGDRARLEMRIAVLEHTIRDLADDAGNDTPRTGQSAPARPERCEQAAPASNGMPAADGERVCLEDATFDELRVVGLSVTQAKRLLRSRDRGHFSDGSLEPLAEIPGFPRTLRQALRRRLTV